MAHCFSLLKLDLFLASALCERVLGQLGSHLLFIFAGLFGSSVFVFDLINLNSRQFSRVLALYASLVAVLNNARLGSNRIARDFINLGFPLPLSKVFEPGSLLTVFCADRFGSAVH